MAPVEAHILTLTIDPGSGSEQTYPLGKETVSIGASSGNDIVLRAPGVAPNHLVIRLGGEVVTFQGQQRQVVVLNGERRSRGVLKDGDKIRIGTATLVIHDLAPAGGTDEEVFPESRGEAPPSAPAESESESRGESEVQVALYGESQRLTEGRRRLVEIFRATVRSELTPSLKTFLTAYFGERRSMLARLDEGGRFQAIVSSWPGPAPRLAASFFPELEGSGRFAVVNEGELDLLVYPVPGAESKPRGYFLVESSPEDLKEDRLLVGELTRLLAVHWERVESMSALFGPWEKNVRAELEAKVPGTSEAIRVLRDHALSAARSSDPVLICGPRGSGRTFLAFQISWLRPVGEPSIHMVHVRDGKEGPLRMELFTAAEAAQASSLAEKAGGGVVVVREIQRLPATVQRELAALIEKDIESGYGPSVRWIGTTDEDFMTMVAEGQFDAGLFGLFKHHLIRVPALDDRREDLPLIIVRLLETLGSEQGKEISAIDLETLGSLLQQPFKGQMAELLGVLRRLVSGAVPGEAVSESGRLVTTAEGGASGEGDGLSEAAALLAEDDLKRVIPAAERLIIDRVLRRTLGNQSRAARELNLSRGSLIAKIKEYEIPDYRSLRRNR